MILWSIDHDRVSEGSRVPIEMWRHLGHGHLVTGDYPHPVWRAVLDRALGFARYEIKPIGRDFRGDELPSRIQNEMAQREGRQTAFPQPKPESVPFRDRQEEALAYHLFPRLRSIRRFAQPLRGSGALRR